MKIEDLDVCAGLDADQGYHQCYCGILVISIDADGVVLMLFNIKKDGEVSRTVEFEELKELLGFIMGCGCPVRITPDWQSKAWDLEVLKSD